MAINRFAGSYGIVKENNRLGPLQKHLKAKTFVKSRFNPEFIYISPYPCSTRVSLFLLKQPDARGKPKHDASVLRYRKEFCKGLRPSETSNYRHQLRKPEYDECAFSQVD
ncbi:hypothetical protein [Neisseria dentiae]|uniref:hypothetical protein n=1 Tax=Neisseria dentiae TaxID=194197 RepID=UPI0035A1208F